MRLLLLATLLLLPVPPAAAQPKDATFVCVPFSTDLPLPECKGPVHHVVLRCRLVDGGSAILTLDPNPPRFDRFGDPAAPGKPLPRVNLPCTLKLVEKNDRGSLFAIRGPGLVSRLALAAYKDIAPWGDGRLLIHGKDDQVRYVVDLFIPQPKPKP